MNKTISGSLLLALMSACSLLVERSDAQCATDADCLKFQTEQTGRTVCENKVCVASGLGPTGCFFGTPTTNAEFLNACSTAACRPFDNCARIGLCDGGAPPSDPTPPPTSVPGTAVVNPTPGPTVTCSQEGVNVIYMYGAADFAPLLKAVQPLLNASTPAYRAVFQNASSCAGVTSIFSPDPTKRLIKDVPSTPTRAANYAFFFDESGAQVNCLLDPAGNTVEIGVSDLYSTTCDPSYKTGQAFAGYTGPVVAFSLAVPSGSSQEVISAEAARLVFGRGGLNPAGKDAAPWTNPTFLFIRNSGAASTVLTSELIKVPKTAFWGVDRLSTDNLRDSMQASSAPEASMGILSIDYADKGRGNSRVLYLQAPGQACGYLPDSTATSFDKMNVRDGHFPLWGYVQFFTPIGAGGVPSAAVASFVTRFSVPRLDQNLVDGIIAASLVPQCAMKVARTAEIGDFTPNNLNFQCGCYFDFKTTGKTSCSTCVTSADCPTAMPACNYGYCEKK
jgi:hypothetical protein